MSGERGTYHFRVEPGNDEPGEGEDIRTQGLAGIYLVHITKITKREIHSKDGAILLTFEGTRQLVEPIKRGDGERP